MGTGMAAATPCALLVLGAAIQGANGLNVQDAVEIGESDVAADEATEEMFRDFIRSHAKSYDSAEEYTRRMAIFGESVRFVEQWNTNPDSKFRVAVNEFADLTGEEFAARYLNDGLETENKQTPLNSVTELVDESSGRHVVSIGEDEGIRNGAMHENSGDDLPDSVDWAHQGRTGSVYKQGVCAACYTFATNAAIEGQYFISTGRKMPELSDQEILSCSRPFGNHGCIGGNMEKSYHYIMSAQEQRGGVTLAKDYPYEGSETACKRDKHKAQSVKLAGYRKISRGSESDLKDAVAKRPVAVGIDAHHPAFKLYSSGVFDIDYCTTHLTHAVLVVGYGTTSEGTDFWKLQNSWGKDWGTNGYGKIARGKNMCSISNLASYPVLEKPETWFEDDA